MANPFAHEPRMTKPDRGEPRPELYEMPRSPLLGVTLGTRRGTTAHLCRRCRMFYVAKPPDKDDLPCPAKLLQVMKEKLL